jgi:hypothetical protein
METNAEETYGDLENLLFCTICPSTDPRGMWLCAYEEDKLPITITMHLSQRETLAVLRVWVSLFKGENLLGISSGRKSFCSYFPTQTP